MSGFTFKPGGEPGVWEMTLSAVNAAHYPDRIRISGITDDELSDMEDEIGEYFLSKMALTEEDFLVTEATWTPGRIILALGLLLLVVILVVCAYGFGEAAGRKTCPVPRAESTLWQN